MKNFYKNINIVDDIKLFENNINVLQKKIKIKKDFNLKNLVNFNNYKNLPFQNWCNYQEGFSPEIYQWFVEYNNILEKNALFLDPFCGSGSSLIQAKKNGVRSIGIDINPFSCLISEVKLDFYQETDFEFIKTFTVPQFKNIDDPFSKYEFSMVNKIFSKENLIKLDLLKDKIKSVKSKKSRKFLFTVLLCCLEECSNYKKAGNGIKRRKKNNDQDFNRNFLLKKDRMLEDIISIKSNVKSVIFNQNVKNIENLLKNDSISHSLFSPPYPNCFDYFEVYKIELWFGEFIKSYQELKILRKKALTSNLNANLNQLVKTDKISNHLNITIKLLQKEELWNKNIPKMICLYFQEMKEFLDLLFRKLKKGGMIGIVIGNSSYAGIPILSDLILCEIASSLGFKINEVIITRNNETSSQQYKKLGAMVQYVRESVLLIQK